MNSKVPSAPSGIGRESVDPWILMPVSYNSLAPQIRQKPCKNLDPEDFSREFRDPRMPAKLQLLSFYVKLRQMN